MTPVTTADLQHIERVVNHARDHWDWSGHPRGGTPDENVLDIVRRTAEAAQDGDIWARRHLHRFFPGFYQLPSPG